MSTQTSDGYTVFTTGTAVNGDYAVYEYETSQIPQLFTDSLALEDNYTYVGSTERIGSRLPDSLPDESVNAVTTSEPTRSFSAMPLTSGIEIGQFGNLVDIHGKVQKTTLTLNDGNGEPVKFQLSGPGYGVVEQGDDDAWSVVLYGTTEKTTLKINGKKGSSAFVQNIDSQGNALKQISAANVNVTGDIDVQGGLAKLTIGDISSDDGVTHNIVIGGSNKTSISGKNFKDVSLDASDNLIKVKVADWTNSNSTVETIEAALISGIQSSNNLEADIFAYLIGKISAKNDVDSTINSLFVNGFSAKNNFTGTIAADYIKNVSIGGDATDVFILGGSNLGLNNQFGGGDDWLADLPGGVVKVAIKGDAHNLVVGSGINPVDGILFNGDDVLAGADSPKDYAVKSFKVDGNITGDSYLIALNPPKSISVNKQKSAPQDSSLYTTIVPNFSTSFSSSTDSVVMGQIENVIFTYNLGVTGRDVGLYEVDPIALDWTSGDFLLNLYDDGNYLHGDATANDGIYSNIIDVQGDAAGESLAFAGVVNLSRSQTATIDVISPSEHLFTSSTDVVVEGIPENIHFTYNVGSTGHTVGLYKVDPVDLDWESGDFLLNLYDDGNASHGDTVAGDGIYSNIIAVQGDTAGESLGFAGVVDSSSSDTAVVDVVSAPSLEEAQAELDFYNSVQNVLTASLEGGAGDQEALDDVLEYLQSAPGVVTDSIWYNDNIAGWVSSLGINYGVSLFPEEERASEYTLTSDDAASFSQSFSATLDEELVLVGEAIVIAPFKYDFEPTDESNEIADMLSDHGMDVTTVYNTSSAVETVSISSFKNLGQYEAVIITSHGDTAMVNNRESVIICTNDRMTTAGELISNFTDLATGRSMLINNAFAITPSFISYYSGSFDDSIIYVGSCRSTYNSTMANAFINAGAGAYIGYDNYVGYTFAYNHGKDAFVELVDGDTVSELDDLGDTDSAPDYAVFEYIGDEDATLPIDGILLNDHELWIEYKWGQNVSDLDTGTAFLGVTVGWSWNSSGEYLDWSGDDISAGGSEQVVVDLNSAFDDGMWSGTTTVSMMAGWYIPHDGYGPATLTVALRNINTGELENTVQKTISPGEQSSAATTPVGSVEIKSQREGDAAIVSFAWS